MWSHVVVVFDLIITLTRDDYMSTNLKRKTLTGILDPIHPVTVFNSLYTFYLCILSVLYNVKERHEECIRKSTQSTDKL